MQLLYSGNTPRENNKGWKQPSNQHIKTSPPVHSAVNTGLTVYAIKENISAAAEAMRAENVTVVISLDDSWTAYVAAM